MTAVARGPIVVDTNVFSARLRTRAHQLTALYDPIITSRKWFVSFQTVMEVESGALIAGWGKARRNPADPDITRIGEELAAARALCDLAHQLLHSAATELEDRLGKGVTVHR